MHREPVEAPVGQRGGVKDAVPAVHLQTHEGGRDRVSCQAQPLFCINLITATRVWYDTCQHGRQAPPRAPYHVVCQRHLHERRVDHHATQRRPAATHANQTKQREITIAPGQQGVRHDIHTCEV